MSAEEREQPEQSARRLAAVAITATAASVAVTAIAGALGPSAAVPSFPAAAPWPPWFAPADPSPTLVSAAVWVAVLLAGVGLCAGLLAARRGWRPRPGRLIAGSLVAVVALMVIPPVGSTDMMDYAVYGRIAALGHSPYRMTPLQLRETGDPVGAAAPVPWETDPSLYGPLATATEWMASELAGPSAARTVFWLKVWNGLAYLAVALALDRLARADAARRTRVHLLWSVNPLLLLEVMAGGHVDVVSAALAVFALAALCPGGAWRPEPRRWVLAGALLGAAAAVKAPLLLVAAGLGWAARRSRRALATLGLAMLAVLVPCYLIAGWPAVAAVSDRAAGSPSLYDPWQLLGRAVGVQIGNSSIDIVAAFASVILAVIMLRRMPAGLAGYPFARPALALMLAWLITTPQQRPWYDAAIFPLLALMPATRLDWIVVVRTAAAALAELPGVTYYALLNPGWLAAAGKTVSTIMAPLVLAGAGVALLWLCWSESWNAPDRGRAESGPLPLPLPTPAEPRRS
jgi:hypothetical protein